MKKFGTPVGAWLGSENEKLELELVEEVELARLLLLFLLLVLDELLDALVLVLVLVLDVVVVPVLVRLVLRLVLRLVVVEVVVVSEPLPVALLEPPLLLDLCPELDVVVV